MKLVIKAETLSDNIQVLRLAGSITQGEGATALNSSLKQISQPGHHSILDLSGVDYIDSTGLGVIVSGYMTAQKVGASIVLAALSKKIRDQLMLTKLDAIFNIYETVNEAKAAIEEKTQ